MVEKYAHGLYPDALRINRNASLSEILAESNEALLRPIFNKPTFNAVLEAKDLIAEIDILLPLENGDFDLYEVKATTEPQPHHLPDIAFQRHVLISEGLTIRHCFLLTLNNKYIRQGEIEPNKLFNKSDVTDGVENIFQEIGHQISMAQEMMANKECPRIEIGAHCDCPYECPMKEICWEKINKNPNNIFTLTRMKTDDKWALFNQGIIKNTDLPADYKLMPRQKLQIETEKTGQMHVNKKALKEFLDGLAYPMYYLDFETIAPAIPMVDGVKPYQQVPFQFSLQVVDAPDKNPYDFGWIWGGNDEVWRSMLFQLKQFLGRTGSVVAYNASFERNVLKWAVKMQPEYGDWLDGVLERFVDLLEPFRNFVVYHPGQHGSCSLKSVLPALTGQRYDHLQVQNGEIAGWTFRRMLESEDEEESEGLRDDLEKYCRLDTFGLVLILKKLQELSR